MIIKISDVEIPDVNESFHPHEWFATGKHHCMEFFHDNGFIEHFFVPAQLVGNVPLQRFIKYQNKINLYDREIRAQIGNQIITPEELWATWKYLIFQQLEDQNHVIKNHDTYNTWYVRCYDGVIRAVSCAYGPFGNMWGLHCREVDHVFWFSNHYFFSKGSSKSIISQFLIKSLILFRIKMSRLLRIKS